MSERFAEMWVEALKARRPQEYQRLQQSGRLDEVAQEYGEAASERLGHLMSLMAKQTPLPRDYLACVRRRHQDQSVAEETVIAELVEMPSESAENAAPTPM